MTSTIPETIPGTYRVVDLPPRTGGSRFSLGTGPGGVSLAKPSQAILLAYESLLANRRAEAASRPLLPPLKLVSLKKVIISETGDYELVDSLLTITERPDAEPVGSGRFGKIPKSGGEVLDLCFRGELNDGTNDQLFAASRELAEQEGFTGRDLRRLNSLISDLVLCRAGITTIQTDGLNL